MPERVSYRVYYEDTDSLGVVYYANYFKYFERGRSEFLRAHGHDVADLNARGFGLVVHAVSATFRKPAALGELVEVVTSFAVTSAYRGRFTQRVERDGELLVDGVVDVVCLDGSGQLIEMPAELTALSEP